MSHLHRAPPVTGRTVLITGGAGFIGSHLVEGFVEGNEVRVLDDFSTGRRANLPPNVPVFEGGILDDRLISTAFDDVDLVFHLAAEVSVDRSVASPRHTHAVNGDGTLGVLEAARRQDARVIVASSAAVYGEPESVPIQEDARLTPRSPYGASKLAVDHYARLYHDLYGLPSVVLRPFNVYGPRQPANDYSGVIRTFIDKALRGDPITVHGDGSQTRDFVHVSDVVRAFAAATTTDACGEAFNVATGRSVSIAELAETVQELVDTDVEVVHTDARPGDIQYSQADISRATDVLGYTPSVDLTDGLEDLIAKERNH